MPSNPLLPQELLSFIQASAQNGINPPSLPSGYVYATPPTSDGHLYLRRFDAAYITTGIIDPNRLGTGATGAGNLYLADDGTWKLIGGGGGGGDMLKATYDVDNDGVVDSAERTEIIVRNSTGTTLTKGTVVYLSGATGNRPNAVRAQADTEATSSKTFGIVVANIANNSDGYVACNGTLHDLDTSAFADGDAVWLSATTAGGMTSTIPAEPNHTVFIGYVARSHPTQGRLVILIQNGYELNELHGVLISSEANNDLLVYESSTTLWKNKSISTIFGGTPLVSVPTLAQVTTAGNTTTNAITVGNATVNGPVNSVFAHTPTTNYTGFGGVQLNVADGTERGFFKLSPGTGEVKIGAVGSGYFTTLYTAGLERMRIFFSSGNVAINTTTDAGYKLDVNGTVRASGAIRTDAGNTVVALNLQGATSYIQATPSNGTSSIVLNSQSSSLILSTTANNFADVRQGYGLQHLRIGQADSQYGGDLRFYMGNSGGMFTWSINAGGAEVMRLPGTGNLLIGTTTDSGAKLTVAGSITAASLLAQGVYFNNTLVAAANNDVLVGLDINPTFTNGAFTGVTNYAIRSVGTFYQQLPGFPTFGLSISTDAGGHSYITKPNTTDLAISGAGHIKLNSGGFVGIGIPVGGYSIKTLFSVVGANSPVPSLGTANGLFTVLSGSAPGQYGLQFSVAGTGMAYIQNMRVDASATAYTLSIQPAGGNVLIGTGTDSGYKLDVVGADSRFNGVRVGLGAGGVSGNTAVGNSALNVNTTGSNNTAIGFGTLLTNTVGNQNTAIGTLALNNSTSSGNTAIGYYALLSNSTGGSNVAIGSQSLQLNLTGDSNIAIGRYAALNTNANGNIAIGNQAIYSNTAGTDNVGIGNSALRTNVTGINNVAIGGGGVLFNNTASNNTAVGYQSGYSNTSGNTNAFFGYQTGYANTTGTFNVAMGGAALQGNTTGDRNAAIGYASGASNTTGTYNVSMGAFASQNNVTGGSNTSIGGFALFNNTASNNTAIGYGAGFSGVANTTGANNIFIGYQATGVSATESNRTWIGNSSTTSTWLAGNVLVGTTTDAGYKLDVNGSVRFGSSTFGYGGNLVTLTSDVGTSTLRVGGGGALFVSGALSVQGSNVQVVDYFQGVRILLGNGNARLAAATVSWLNVQDSSGGSAAGNLSANLGTFGTTYAIINASAQVEIASTTKGFLQPRMTNAQALAITTPATGLQVYDTTNNKNLLYNGTLWQNVATESWVSAQGYLTSQPWVVSGSNIYYSTGSVGIGTVPSYPLHISSAAAANIFGTVQSTNANGTAAWVAFNDQSDNVVYRVFGSGASGTQMGIALARTASLIANLGGSGKFLIGTYSGTDLVFGTSDTARMRLVDSTGNFLVGTMTDLGNKLEVSGTINATDYKVGNVPGWNGIINIPTMPPIMITVTNGIITNVM